MVKLLMNLWAEESGQGMAEYGLILALVAVVTIGAFQLLGGGIDEKVRQVGDSITSAGEAAAP